MTGVQTCALPIFVDQSPLAISMPTLYLENFQNAEDYYDHALQGGWLRFFRVCLHWIGLLLPALYLALVSFNQEFLPVSLLMPIARARDAMPFSAFVEVLMVQFIISLILQAQARVPKLYGNALGIFSGVVVGQALLIANLASPTTMIVMTIATLAHNLTPQLQLTNRVLSLMLTIVSGFFGLYGLMLGTVMLIAYLMNKTSLGVPFMAPYAPMIASDLKDGFGKFKSISKFFKRPYSIPSKDKIRQAPHKK